jgi:hypothetical protein
MYRIVVFVFVILVAAIAAAVTFSDIQVPWYVIGAVLLGFGALYLFVFLDEYRYVRKAGISRLSATGRGLVAVGKFLVGR